MALLLVMGLIGVKGMIDGDGGSFRLGHQRFMTRRFLTALRSDKE
jgi:hypothetical protein